MSFEENMAPSQGPIVEGIYASSKSHGMRTPKTSHGLTHSPKILSGDQNVEECPWDGGQHETLLLTETPLQSSLRTLSDMTWSLIRNDLAEGGLGCSVETRCPSVSGPLSETRGDIEERVQLVYSPMGSEVYPSLDGCSGSDEDGIQVTLPSQALNTSLQVPTAISMTSSPFENSALVELIALSGETRDKGASQQALSGEEGLDGAFGDQHARLSHDPTSRASSPRSTCHGHTIHNSSEGPSDMPQDLNSTAVTIAKSTNALLNVCTRELENPSGASLDPAQHLSTNPDWLSLLSLSPPTASPMDLLSAFCSVVLDPVECNEAVEFLQTIRDGTSTHQVPDVLRVRFDILCMKFRNDALFRKSSLVYLSGLSNNLPIQLPHDGANHASGAELLNRNWVCGSANCRHVNRDYLEMCTPEGRRQWVTSLYCVICTYIRPRNSFETAEARRHLFIAVKNQPVTQGQAAATPVAPHNHVTQFSNLQQASALQQFMQVQQAQLQQAHQAILQSMQQLGYPPHHQPLQPTIPQVVHVPKQEFLQSTSPHISQASHQQSIQPTIQHISQASHQQSIQSAIQHPTASSYGNGLANGTSSSASYVSPYKVTKPPTPRKEQDQRRVAAIDRAMSLAPVNQQHREIRDVNAAVALALGGRNYDWQPAHTVPALPSKQAIEIITIDDDDNEERQQAHTHHNEEETVGLLTMTQQSADEAGISTTDNVGIEADAPFEFDSDLLHEWALEMERQLMEGLEDADAMEESGQAATEAGNPEEQVSEEE